MTIQYLNHSSFLIKTKYAGNSQIKVVIDPFDDSTGFKFKSTEADIVLVSHNHKDHANVAGIKGLEPHDLINDDIVAETDKPFIISTPGEFEIKGVHIKGIQSFHDGTQGKDRGPNIIYTIRNEGFSVCHLGDLGHMIDQKHVEEIGDVDVLLLPVGGVFTIGPETATEVISAIEPSIVIPMHYKTEKHSSEFAELSTLQDFAKEYGQEDFTLKDILDVSKSVEEGTKMVVLKPEYH
jgi:L-ascorbate metabolism protein UlaG (beta-lactamase superfamily)